MCRKPENRATLAALLKALAIGLASIVLVPSGGASVTPPSQPGPWQLVGKASVSRLATISTRERGRDSVAG